MSQRNERKRGRNEQEEEETSKRAVVETPTSIEGNDDNDWKRPLFYWKGKAELSKGKMAWKGSWSSDIAENGLPSSDLFESTKAETSFELTSTGKLSSEDKDFTFRGLRGRFKGSYLLDQGDGPERYRDKTHHFALASSEGPNLLAVACGTTEFGNFVSAGFLKDNELVLARRYLGETDERNSWKANPRKVLEWCQEQEVELDTKYFWTKLLPRHR